MPKSDTTRFPAAPRLPLVIEPQNANLPPLLEEPGSRQENLEFPEAKGLYSAPVG